MLLSLWFRRLVSLFGIQDNTSQWLVRKERKVKERKGKERQREEKRREKTFLRSEFQQHV